jgi:hypothetical protein
MRQLWAAGSGSVCAPSFTCSMIRVRARRPSSSTLLLSARLSAVDSMCTSAESYTTEHSSTRIRYPCTPPPLFNRGTCPACTSPSPPPRSCSSPCCCCCTTAGSTREDPATSLAQREICPQVCYFQLSDVGNFRTSNHEMWILLFVCLSLGCLLWA